MHGFRVIRPFLAAAATLTAIGVAPAAAGDGVLGLLIENDTFAHTDRYYTSGVKLSYVTGQGRGEKLARLLRVREGEPTRLGFALGHSIFTPENRGAVAPLPNDHPYAGWFYGEVSIIAERRSRALDMLTLDFGVVGPHAFGKGAQDFIHELIGDDKARGWANQLRDEPGFILSYDRLWPPIISPSAHGVGVDLTPHTGVSIGNVLTQANAGVTFRIGSGLSGSYGPPRVRPSIPTGGFYGGSGFSWYVFAGGEARAIARNVFLDGNTFRDSLSVDKKVFGADAQGGLVLQMRGVALAFTYVWRAREFDTQSDAQQFGAISFSTRF
ncbi:MAG: lipid A deacylase LpxR family protein [Amphiplicatus sp.]